MLPIIIYIYIYVYFQTKYLYLRKFPTRVWNFTIHVKLA